MTENSTTPQEATQATPPAARAPHKARHRPKPGPSRKPAPALDNPVLQQLAQLYPHLFGASFRPLKRGIFQDLMAAHPGVFEAEALKEALAFHTRSTRYLAVVAEGQPRIDLTGSAAEAMAPQHVFYALLEVHRRRQSRSQDDLRPKLRQRLVQAIMDSGLAPKAYDELVRGSNPAAHAILDEALADIATQSAKDEALARAFEAQSQSVQAFADAYGLAPAAVEQALQRARPQTGAPAA